MELSQKVRIPAPQEIVWENLNDPAMLKECLPGCQEFAARAENEFDVVVVAKVGPVKATFKGEVILSDVAPPSSYRIAGNGKGGVAGFAKGQADVSLVPTDDGNGTVMTYTVKAAVGGKLAQVGSRLVSGAARKMADSFFAGFVRQVVGGEDGKEIEVQIETIESMQETQASQVSGDST